MSTRARPVVIDDTDPGIRYSGEGWFQDSGSQDKFGNFGPTYKHTLHGTNRNDSLSFSFEGTSITVVGTTHLVRIDNGTRFDPTWECFVDNISIGSTAPFEFPENNWSLCGRSSLSDGPHEITVKVTTTGNTFWFDSLRFIPSPTASYESAVLLVDNHDPGIFYDSKWRALGGTANFTTETGSQVKFEFTGTSLSWVGFIPTELPHNSSSGTYAIDGGSPVTFRLEGLPADGTTTVYNQVFFSTSELAAGPHSIIVTYTGNRQLTPLTFDYLYITNTSTLQTSSTLSSSPSSSASSSSSGPSATSGNSEVKENSNTPVGAIAGGVVGGLTLLIAILVFFWWRRRKQRIAESHGLGHNGSTYIPPNDVTPFMSTYQPASQHSLPMAPTYQMPGSESQLSSYQASSRQPTTNTNFTSHAHTMSISSSEPSNSSPGGYVSGAVAQMHNPRKGQTTNQQALRATNTVIHEDSGLRLPHRDGVVEDIPPHYTAV